MSGARLVILLASFLILLWLLGGVDATGARQGGWLELKYSVARTGFDPRSWSWGGRHYIDYNVSSVFRAGLCIASNPVVADVDGDGVDDIVFPSCDSYTYAIHGGDYRVLWKTRTGLGLVSPAAADLDGDGGLDVVVAGPGVLYAINARTGVVEWKTRGLFYKASPGIGDVDCDDRLEVVANTLDGRVAVISSNGSVEALIRVGSSEVEPPALGDVDGDGCPDIVVAEESYVHVVWFDKASSSWRVSTISLEGHISGYPALYDINGDGVLDILVASNRFLYAIDYRGSKILFRAGIDGSSYSSPSIGDVDGDGSPDIVLATTSALYVFAVNGSLLHKYPGVNAAFGSAIITDIDGDGVNELIVARYDGELDIVDLVHGGGDYYNGTEYAYVAGAPFMAPAAVGDVDGDGLPEVIVGNRDFNLYVVDGVAEATAATGAGGATASPTAPPQPSKASTSSAIGASPATSHSVTASSPSTTCGSQRTSSAKAVVTSGPSHGYPGIDYRLLAGLGVFLVALAAALVIASKRRG